MPTDTPDHLNNIERALIDNLRDGTYNTIAGIGSGSAWASEDVTVFGQFPTTDEASYPCIITEMVANGIETQFMGQNLTTGSNEAIGELYGVGFNIYISVDSDSSITITNTTATGSVAQPYKERRLLNYLMLNCANVLIDCDFVNITKGVAGTPAPTEIVERHFSGFSEMGYNAQLETWTSIASLVIVFKNSR